MLDNVIYTDFNKEKIDAVMDGYEAVKKKMANKIASDIDSRGISNITEKEAEIILDYHLIGYDSKDRGLLYTELHGMIHCASNREKYKK